MYFSNGLIMVKKVLNYLLLVSGKYHSGKTVRFSWQCTARWPVPNGIRSDQNYEVCGSMKDARTPCEELFGKASDIASLLLLLLLLLSCFSDFCSFPEFVQDSHVLSSLYKDMSYLLSTI